MENIADNNTSNPEVCAPTFEIVRYNYAWLPSIKLSDPECLKRDIKIDQTILWPKNICEVRVWLYMWFFWAFLLEKLGFDLGKNGISNNPKLFILKIGIIRKNWDFLCRDLQFIRMSPYKTCCAPWSILHANV